MDKKDSLATAPQPTLIRMLSEPHQLQEFLDQPGATIAAAVIGGLAEGQSGLVLAGGRILQAAFKAQTFKQVAKEIRRLVENGKLKEDFADTPLGFKSLLELIEFIDSEAPDEDRLRAVQAVFYSVNATDTADAERLILHELFRVAKQLSGGQVRLLAHLYKVVRRDARFEQNDYLMPIHEWMVCLTNGLGHSMMSLVELDETGLVHYKLLSARYDGDTKIVRKNARLTDLGMKVCEMLERYDQVKKDVGEEPARQTGKATGR